MKRRAFVAGAAGLVFSVPLGAEETVQAGAKALSGDRFIVNGIEHRLADIVAPPIYALSDGDRAYFDQSKIALQALLDDASLSLREVSAPGRWGTRIVAVETASGESAQAVLVAAGAVRVAPQTDDLALIDGLLLLEDEARAERRGLWRLDAYRLRDANSLQEARSLIGAYHILEGRVMRAAATRGRTYLNFGDDYRTDFTASARSRLARRWVRAGFDLSVLEGQRVRVRGFIDSINGPSAELTHIRQIAALPADNEAE